MPPCGTGEYAGAVTDVALRARRWQMVDVTGAEARATGDSLMDHRIVGWRPAVELSATTLTLRAFGRARAVVAALSFDVTPVLLELLRPGDVLHIGRNSSADIGLGVVRPNELVLAAGDVASLTRPPLVFHRPRQIERIDWAAVFSENPSAAGDDWPRYGPLDHADVTLAGCTLPLAAGNSVTLDGRTVTVVSTAVIGLPGQAANLAYSRDDVCTHAAAVLLAQRLAWGAGIEQFPHPPWWVGWWLWRRPGREV